MKTEPDEKQEEQDPSEWKDNCRDDIKNAMPEQERQKAADKFGPNWASVMAGCGDQ